MYRIHSSYLPIYLSTYLSTYLPTYLPTLPLYPSHLGSAGMYCSCLATGSLPLHDVDVGQALRGTIEIFVRAVALAVLRG